MTPTVLLVGHRATGKTTLAISLATSYPDHVDVIDLDQDIARAQGESCEAIIARSMAEFRALERAHLSRLLATPSPDRTRVIVPGAGMLDLPEDVPVVWIWRAGWAQSARQERVRLRPEVPWGEEVAWMTQSREPVWRQMAHVRLTLEPGTPPSCDAQTLWEWITLLTHDQKNTLAQKSWLVPTTTASLPRDAHDVSLFGLAGIEVRSDFFDTVPKLAVPLLGSVRTPGLEWAMEHLARFAHLDLDISMMKAGADHLASALHAAPQGFPVTLSLHPQRDDLTDLDTLLAWASTLKRLAPGLQVGIKYAPPSASWQATEAGWAATRAIAHPRLTWLPQAPEFAWIRPLLGNHLNYIKAGRLESRFSPDAHAPTPWDLCDWLPHIRGKTPERFEALVGDPVTQSQGDRFHRVQALLSPATHDTSYVKIPVKKDDFPHALACLAHVGILHVSVTSPHKHLAGALAHEAHAVNTLRWHHGHWAATDTDAQGMLAIFRDLEACGIPPGQVIVFGKGGVSQALLHAIKASGWSLGAHLSARAGWPQGSDRIPKAHLIINASGDRDSAYENAPETLAWVDLHYTSVRPHPAGVHHRNGALFFAAQALAQRDFWSLPSPTSDPKGPPL